MNTDTSVQEFCTQYGLTEDQFYGRTPVDDHLSMGSVEELPAGFNPKVRAGLYLNSVETLPENFSPVVNFDLSLRKVKTLPVGFNPVVGSDLYLNSIETLPPGFSPTVGGNLYLSSVKKLPEGFNPIVRGNLVLDSVKALPVGYRPVAHDLYPPQLISQPSCIQPPQPLTWRDGHYVLINGLLGEVISRHGPAYQMRMVGTDKVLYAVTNGAEWAHGETMEEARENLNRDESEFLELDDPLMLEVARIFFCAVDPGSGPSTEDETGQP